MLSLKATVTIAGVAGVAFLGMATLLVYQDGRIATLEANLRTEALRTSSTKEACSIAQAGDIEVIRVLREANGQCVRSRDQVAASGAAAVDQAERQRREGWAAYYQQQREQEQAYVDDPECRAWGADPVCPAVAGRLRDERAADPAPAGGDRAPSVRGGAAGADPADPGAATGAGHDER